MVLSKKRKNNVTKDSIEHHIREKVILEICSRYLLLTGKSSQSVPPTLIRSKSYDKIPKAVSRYADSEKNNELYVPPRPCDMRAEDRPDWNTPT